MTDLKWWHDAECLQYGPGLFEPAPGTTGFDSGQTAEARQVCAACPVRRECLDEAIATRDTTTIRGGMTPSERRIIKRRRKAAA